MKAGVTVQGLSELLQAGKGMWKNYGKGVGSLADDEKVIGFICGKGE